MILGDSPLGDTPLASPPLFGIYGSDVVLSADIRTAPVYAAAVKSEARFDAEITTEPES